MNKRQVQIIQTRLEERRRELQEQIVELDSGIVDLAIEQEQERGGLGNHMADDGSSLGEQEIMSTLESDFHALLTDVENALKRIEDGDYGICQRCGERIDEERLEAVPYAQYCIRCQTHLERQSEMFGVQAAT